MKFLDMLADTSYATRQYNGDLLQHLASLGPCKQCAGLTFFLSKLYNVRLCSTECHDAYAQERV